MGRDRIAWMGLDGLGWAGSGAGAVRTGVGEWLGRDRQNASGSVASDIYARRKACSPRTVNALSQVSSSPFGIPTPVWAWMWTLSLGECCSINLATSFSLRTCGGIGSESLRMSPPAAHGMQPAHTLA